MRKRWKRSFVTALSVALAVGNCVPAMAAPAGWRESAAGWQYVNANGSVQKGWFQDANKQWYFLDYNTGVMKTGWIKPADGKWYFMDYHTGAMKTGWIKPMDGKWYYLNPSNGDMQTGWVQTPDSKWYYLDTTSGAMQTGSITIGNQVWTLDANGVWDGKSSTTAYVSTSTRRPSSSSSNTGSGDNAGSGDNTETPAFSGNGWKADKDGNVTIIGSDSGVNVADLKEKVPTIKNLTIEADLGENAPLEGLKVTGNLTISDKVADGTVILNEVDVDGETIVNGGGHQSVRFNKCQLKGAVKTGKNSGKALHIVFGKDTQVLGEVNIDGENVILETHIVIEDLVVNASILVKGTGKITNFNIASSVAVTLQVSVTTLKINSSVTDATIDVAKEDEDGNSINVGTVDGDAVITGDGKVNGYYDVTLDANGGCWVIGSIDEATGEEKSEALNTRVLKVEDGKAVSTVIDHEGELFEAPTQTGKDFGGWTDSATGTEQADLTSTASKTYYAMWNEAVIPTPSVTSITVTVSGEAVTATVADNKATLNVTTGSAVSAGDVVPVEGLESDKPVSIEVTKLVGKVNDTDITEADVKFTLSSSTPNVGSEFTVEISPADNATIEFEPVTITVEIKLQ